MIDKVDQGCVEAKSVALSATQPMCLFGTWSNAMKGWRPATPDIVSPTRTSAHDRCMATVHRDGMSPNGREKAGEAIQGDPKRRRVHSIEDPCCAMVAISGNGRRADTDYGKQYSPGGPSDEGLVKRFRVPRLLCLAYIPAACFAVVLARFPLG